MSIDRRKFLKGALLLPSLSKGRLSIFGSGKNVFEQAEKFRRVRPGDTLWPSPESWDKLNHAVNGSLIKIESPLSACKASSDNSACIDLFKGLKNPYYIGDNPALTQTSGWLDAWSSAPSVYAVAAKNAADIVAAVNFARENNLRLVVKGGGHSYQGTSNSADSLLIWTRAMNDIVLHEDFVPQDCAGKLAPQPAVTAGSGAIWIQMYNAVTTQAGRYVQGGGCATVGVAGLIQSGGFGSFSKNYGLAAAGLLEAEVVIANGKTLIANACTNQDLFWALKGGGGGSLGVISRLTLKTHELPASFGGAFGTIKAKSDSAFLVLISQIISFYNDRLFNQHWGEQIRFHSNNSISISMVFQGLTQQEAAEKWRPFREIVSNASQDYEWISPLTIVSVPAQHLWDGNFLKTFASNLILSDDRPNAPAGNIFWASNLSETGQFLYAYHSAWLSASLLNTDKQSILANALFAASRNWTLSLHLNKGLAGAPPNEIALAKDTATNPAVLDAFALVIIAGEGDPAFAGVSGHEPNITEARNAAGKINKAFDEMLKIAPNAGSYLSESNFFLKDWQRAFWGSNYERLVAVKKKYDPDGLFFVHHGVGSEKWSDDGFTRLK